jgi:hypothetical protein
MHQWVEHFPTFSDMIERELAEEAYGGLLFDNFRIVGFVDCKIDPTCRPGSGPVVDCQLAPRHEGHDILQESVYSGYAKCHGLKVLTVVFPNGLIGCLYGAVSAWENNCRVLNYSGLNAELMRLQPEVSAARARGENLSYYSLYGDAIFPVLHCITQSHRPPIGGELNDRKEEEDFAMRRIRTSVEWPYETATNLFHILQSKYNKHLLGHNRASNVLIGQQLRV